MKTRKGHDLNRLVAWRLRPPANYSSYIRMGGGFCLAPGAHACQALDIMSVAEGCVGAETFVAVTPRNNGKLDADLLKLAARQEQHHYVFFMSPPFQGNKRLFQFEQPGVQVWSVDV